MGMYGVGAVWQYGVCAVCAVCHASQLQGGRDDARVLYGCMQALYTAYYSESHTPNLTACSHTRLLYARDRSFSAVVMDTADAPADLQAHFVSALYSTGTIGTYVHDNLHAVYASSSLAQPCITIFPKKRFGCSVCPLNPKSDDGLRACGDGNVNAWSHMSSRVHQSSFRQQTLGLPFDELAFATFTAGNQRRRWSERRAAAAATHLGA